MRRVSEYDGGLLNHIEGVYRPEDQGLVIELAEALGLVVTVIQFTADSRPVIAIHPNPDDRDPTNNVIFLNQISESHRTVVDLMARAIAGDPELQSAVEGFRRNCRSAPGDMPHLGVRFRTAEALDTVIGNLETRLSAALKARVAVDEQPACTPIDGLPDIRQVFVHTDLFCMGGAGFEQAIELQVDRGR